MCLADISIFVCKSKRNNSAPVEHTKVFGPSNAIAGDSDMYSTVDAYTSSDDRFVFKFHINTQPSTPSEAKRSPGSSKHKDLGGIDMQPWRTHSMADCRVFQSDTVL